MKIIVFSRSTTEHFTSGGMETHLKNLVEGLAEKGNELTVVTTSHPDHLNKDFEIDYKKVKYVFLKNTTPGYNPLNSWEVIFYKLGLLNRGVKEGENNYFESSRSYYETNSNKDFDLLISQSTAAYGVYEILKIPFISIIHGTIKTEMKNRWQALKTLKNYIRFFMVDEVKWIYEGLFKNHKFFNKAKKIIAVSEQLKIDFTNDYPDLTDKVNIIPNGVDENIFSMGSLDEKYSQFTTLYIGRMEKEKGIDELIKAIKILEDQDIQAILIGKGVHEEYFKELVKELKLENKVKFLGSIKNENLSEYYKKSHVFVLPSKRVEGHPMTISEAMCSGLPILSTNIGGLKDLFEDGKEGYFISNSNDLALKIKDLLESPDLLFKLSQQSHKKGIRNYSKNAMINKYIECINSI